MHKLPTQERARAGFALLAIVGIVTVGLSVVAALWVTFGWRIGLPALGLVAAILGRSAYELSASKEQAAVVPHVVPDQSWPSQ